MSCIRRVASSPPPFAFHDAVHRCRCLVLRLSNAYSHQKFLFLGGFLAPWSLAATFGIAADVNELGTHFLLVLTAPLLEWQTSQPTKAAGAAAAVSSATAAAVSSATAAARSSAGIADEAAAAHPKRARSDD